ncbi:MAG: hypothetical protein UT30_C0020G0012 [Candidatus Uhrbacteria bacterium GW2011_GWF2_39_13]|uniref:Lipoprotein n=1 Tax=Candidatus Uhrbacteria bacterium GW2011_GWF2_39_13 TaxID=1618995 RepID=A0A0G0MKS9_9BACT|nr:MAG: hypothetical protein UT30_C0020G0012 [Candidatus Uhrbacteria bacterium GW2011_GWF2_39_13]HAU66715.1 hypothetical protein [Candidatus Uhrbacteria bacterium]
MNRSIVILFGLCLLLILGGCDKLCTLKNIGDDDAVVVTPTPLDSFFAQLKIVAPYSWAGTFYAFPYDGRPNDPDCEGVHECVVDLKDEGTLQIAITGDTFLCVNQFATIGQTNDGQTVELMNEWLKEGQCGLAPNDKYGSYEIVTYIADLNGFDQTWIDFGGALHEAVITGNTFYDDDGDRILEGTISDDLTEIWYHYTDGNGHNDEVTLTLND